MAPRTRASAIAQDPPAAVKRDNDRAAKRPAPLTLCEDRGAKRPARGYHTFKSGMLNVTPKGEEQELVESNRDSPLLRLPPEIRNRIWELVLGGMAFRQHAAGSTRKSILQNAPRDAKNAMAVLRVCRQCYAETAILPYSLNSFSSEYYWAESPSTTLRRLRVYQRGQISEVQIHFKWPGVGVVNRFSMCWLHEKTPAMGFPKVLPNLRRIQICFFKETYQPRVSFEELASTLRAKLESDMRSRGYDFIIKRLEKTYVEHENEWSSQPVITTDDVVDE